MFILDFLVFLVCTFLSYKSIKNVYNGCLTIYDILLFVFYSVNVLPLLIDAYYCDKIKDLHPIVSQAMLDSVVSVIYDFFIIVVSLCYYYFSNKYKYKDLHLMLSLKKIKYNNRLVFTLVFLSFLPLVGVLIAPNPFVYFKFAYFYSPYENPTIDEVFYHQNVMIFMVYISLLSLVVYYFNNASNRKDLFVFIMLFITLWLSQKRAVIFFGVGFIIFIDLLRQRYAGNISLFFRKILVLLILSVSYFIVYSNNSIKSFKTDDSYSTYVFYGSRHYCVKTAIHDAIHENSIMEYMGQSTLFDLFFFVPRSLWPDKPYPYQKYFTNHVFMRDMDNPVTSVNLLVNIWTESISNYGIFMGPFLVILLVNFISRISSRDRVCYITATIFLASYHAFGFEYIVLPLYVIWLYSLFHSYRKQTVY